MKKILIGLMTFLFVFGIIGCVDIVTTETTETTEPTTTAATTTTTTTAITTEGTTLPGQTTTATEPTTTTAAPTTTAVPKVYMDLPDDPVEIIFWHIYGIEKSALLDAIIAEFEAMFPNVTITSTSQSDYNTLREKINLGISVGQVPTMALGYPDHYAAYITANAVAKLDTFINSNVSYEVLDSESTIFGDFVDVGLDIEDFVPGYLAENNQYIGGYYYSLPYSKSTETMAVNRTLLKQHATAIRALGIEISDEGFLSHDTPLTFQQLQALTPILTTGTGVTDVEANQCGYLLNYDSSGNMFINLSRQLNAPYTNSAGAILIDNATTMSMLNYINAMFDAKTFVLPIIWGLSYGSLNFKYGDVCMTVGSTAGVDYNVPSLTDTQANLKFGIFDVDFVGVPQSVSESDTAITLTDGTNNYSFTGSLSAVQQGPNIGIFSRATSNEKLFAWLFIKYLTNTDNTARWAMDTGYLPVRLSAYTSEVEIPLTTTFSITYNNFLEIAQEYWDAEGIVDWEVTDEKWDYLHSSMVANIARSQTMYYQYDPAFAAGARSAGSAQARVEAGYCLEFIFVKTYTPTQALNFMKNQLTW